MYSFHAYYSLYKNSLNDCHPLTNAISHYSGCFSLLVQYYTNGSGADCPKPCEEMKYEVSVSQSYYPSEYKVGQISRMLGVSEDYFA